MSPRTASSRAGATTVSALSPSRANFADGTVSLIKQYIGRHWVSYEGQNSGEGIFGRWSISDYWTGKFALRPLADSEEACDEIQELVPA